MNVNDFVRQITRSSDICDAAIPGLPIAEIAGEHRILIENHQGIMQYSRESICVRVKFGQFWVEGTGLELAKMSKEQLVITGQIQTVKILRGC